MSHGEDWECKCIEGHAQSPISLPGPYGLKRINQGAEFEYDPVMANDVDVVFEDNIMKIKGEFGRIIDEDMTEYEAYEIQFHTPAEHQIGNKKFDLEVQVLHRAVTEGDFMKQAVVSVLFERKAGAEN